MENYTGNKKIQGIFQKIINEIPPVNRFCEWFAGGAGIASIINVSPDKIWLNEIDPKQHQKLCLKFPDFINTNENIFSLFLKSLSDPKAIHKNDFLFLDPPYLHETRNSNKLYKFEMRNDEHVLFLDFVKKLKCNVMIIHPKCDLYDTELRDWRKIEITLKYWQKSSTEILYVNYPAPTKLQDYRFVGNDRVQRQQIKRKAENMVKKLLEMPEHERSYILEKIKPLFENST